MKNFFPNEKISILIPVYNEEKTVGKILEKILKETFSWNKEIIVINDGSTDRSLEILKKFSEEIILIDLKNNRGKGFALREGFKRISGEIVIIQDGDLEYDPKDYQKLLIPILEKKTEVVYGSRNLNPENKPSSKIYLYGGKFLTIFFNFFFKTNLTDIMTCYKVFRKRILEKITLSENRFCFDLEITAKIIKNGFSILEVPIAYYPRSRKEGKKITIKDGLRGLYVILKCYFL